jgi:hypothetical protein
MYLKLPRNIMVFIQKLSAVHGVFPPNSVGEKKNKKKNFLWAVVRQIFLPPVVSKSKL